MTPPAGNRIGILFTVLRLRLLLWRRTLEKRPGIERVLGWAQDFESELE